MRHSGWAVSDPNADVSCYPIASRNWVCSYVARWKRRNSQLTLQALTIRPPCPRPRSTPWISTSLSQCIPCGEFFSEIGVIVVGIAIALTGEQLVERWHWSQQTHETEAALRSEIQESVDNVSERFAVDTCLRRQLSLLQTAATNKTPLAKPISVNPLRVAPDLYASPWRAWTRC